MKPPVDARGANSVRDRGWLSTRVLRYRRTGRAIALALMIPALLVTVYQPIAAGAASRRGSYTVGEYAYRKLEKIHELLSAEKLGEAGELLDQLARKSGLNPHETALLYQARGYLSSAEENYGVAADWFDKCLAQDALPESATLNTRYNLAQLYMAVENFDKALTTLEQWFEETSKPAGSAWYLLAAVYTQLDRHDHALEPARRAVQSSKTPAKPWLELLLSLRLEQQRYQAAVPLLEQLVERFADKRYFLQLSAVYSELGRKNDALAIEQVAWEAGLLDRAAELRNLARRYLYHDLPWRAAQVVDKGITDGVIDPGLDDWQLLADAYLLARESERALGPLQKAAAIEPAGPAALQLARLHLANERWQDSERVLKACITALEEMLDAERKNPALEAKPDTERDWANASLLLGISLASAERLEEARQVFEKLESLESDDATRNDARRWIAHISVKKSPASIDNP